MVLNKIPGVSRSPWSTSYNRYLFILISLAQGIIVIIFEGLIYTNTNSNSQVKNYIKESNVANPSEDAEKVSSSVKAMLVYLVLFMFSQVFQVVLSIESVYFKNTLQILGILLFNLMTFVYSIFQLTQLTKAMDLSSDAFVTIKSTITTYVTIVAAVIAACQLILLYLGHKLYKEFGWSIYRIIGSDLSMRKMLLMYHSFLMVLKFDVFFFLGFITQFLVLVLEKDVEYYLTIASVPIIVTILWLGVLGVRQENSVLLGLNLGGFLLGLAYFCFKIFRILTVEKYKDFRYFLSLFAFLSLIFISASLVLAWICLRQFGKGLSRYISGSNSLEQEKRQQEPIDLGGE